jgi:hypothetical protein
MEEGWLWCAFQDCDGDVYDAIEWQVAKQNFPRFPEIPERNVRYTPGAL